MFFFIKFISYFAISFIILSFPIKDKAAFYHLESLARPYTEQIYSFLRTKTKEGKKATKKFFSNSKPSQIDKIETQQSSMEKKRAAKEAARLDDSYTSEEKEMLRKIMTDSSL